MDTHRNESFFARAQVLCVLLPFNATQVYTAGNSETIYLLCCLHIYDNKPALGETHKNKSLLEELLTFINHHHIEPLSILHHHRYLLRLVNNKEVYSYIMYVM